MTDTVTKEKRSWIMSQVRGTDTTPEMIVRSLAHRMGYRYRLHREDLPGKPDIVFPSKQKVIFVHGCFWHGHDCQRGSRIPKTNTKYWREKIEKNRRRDEKNIALLISSGWQTLIIWECQIRDIESLKFCIEEFLRKNLS